MQRIVKAKPAPTKNNKTALYRGHIVEQGTHAELLARGGHYAQLWKRQSGGFIDVEPAAVQAAE